MVLAGLSATGVDALVPKGEGGETATLGALRAQLVWVPRGLLAVTLVRVVDQTEISVLAWKRSAPPDAAP